VARRPGIFAGTAVRLTPGDNWQSDRTKGLRATLLHYARGEAETQVPVWRMISATPAALTERARRIIEQSRLDQSQAPLARIAERFRRRSLSPRRRPV